MPDTSSTTPSTPIDQAAAPGKHVEPIGESAASLDHAGAAGPKQTASKPTRSVAARVFFGLFVAGVIVGHQIGKAWSPDYDDPSQSTLALRSYVATTVKAQATKRQERVPRVPIEYSVIDPSASAPVAEKISRSQATVRDLFSYRPAGETPKTPKELRFGCGYQEYVYDLATRKLRTEHTRLINGSSASARPRKGISLLDSFSFLLGGLEAYQLRIAGPKYVEWVVSDSERAFSRIVVGIALLSSGVGLGVYLGYKNEPKCGEGLFKELLGNTTFWSGVADDVNGGGEPGVLIDPAEHLATP